MSDRGLPATTALADVGIVRDHLGRMARSISGSPLSEGPALAHRALDRIVAALLLLTLGWRLRGLADELEEGLDWR